MALVNIMENLVDAKVTEMLRNCPHCCSCEQCVEDIKALALNNLPPKYVSTLKGELFSKMDSIMIKQHNVDIDVAVLNAIEFINIHPHHDR